MKILSYYLVIFLTCLGFATSSHGQLVVDIGKDTTYCSDPNTSVITMGLKVNVIDGIEPYTFAWECNVIPFGILSPLTANDILNDSTLNSPSIINSIWNYTENKIKFILHVVDYLGNRAKDSIYIDFSKCASTLGYRVIDINKGDSVLLDAGTTQGNIAKYFWEPNYGLSNPDSSATWCKPEVKTDYFLTTIDTIGCQCSNHEYEIRINTTNTDVKLNPQSKINPFQKGSRVFYNNKCNQEALITFFSLDGEFLHQFITNTDNIEVPRQFPRCRIYIIKISINGSIGVCKYLN
jgi:hypothetical protein